MTKAPAPRILIYLLRRDLRLADNPILCEVSRLSSQSQAPFTHLLLVYVFPAQQIEVSGFLQDPNAKSPYPEARSQVGGFWRCGPHRAKFMTESVWDLKQSLQRVNSGLEIRVGMLGDVIRQILDWYKSEGEDGEDGVNVSGDREPGEPKGEVTGVWMTSDDATEEKREERDVRRVVESEGIEFRLWKDEKYFIDDCDLPFSDIKGLPDVYTTFRKSLEPLRDKPRPPLWTPSSLPPLPPRIPPQGAPFSIPTTLEGIMDAIFKPLEPSLGLENPPRWPPDTKSAHPFTGGETSGMERVSHLIASGAMSNYKDTRNGLLGTDFSTKLSAWLALGCITARQIHAQMVRFEDGTKEEEESWTKAEGYGKGENKGTAAVRFELLWRDYMRLCVRKFGPKTFYVSGFRELGEDQKRWKYVDSGHKGGTGDQAKTREAFERFRSGRTGTGFIDASQRELFLTGYTSNRTRQNVASYLSKHLGIDWRLGAEWYESLLIDYDVGNNWGNWQYVSGVGNDPRQGRTFNPVKQALDYDAGGEYTKAWVPELRPIDVRRDNNDRLVDQEKLMGVFQAWRLSEADKERYRLKGLEWVEEPLIRIPFSVGRKPRDDGARGRGRGYRGGHKGRGSWREGNQRRMGEMDKAQAGNETNGGDAQLSVDRCG
ncbi:hypothetical protein H2201_005767 [Coniosporium apollinis]|uniref:Cryptochrome DASH n=1 Tax=Coniosporium apollinis TaxID=61459 RepID=A0ABQ9NPJ8_9PEZI|nr:hypothetical protein H2201_005767 [Coniosporium apollinis]